MSYLLTAFALMLAPLTFVVGLAFNRLMAAADRATVTRSWLLSPAIAGAGLLIGVCSHWWPELPGNGKSILTASLASGMTLTTAAAVLILKPVLTAVFLRTGATGGMLTPALATGAAAGTLFVLVVNAAAGTHYHVPAMSLAGAAGVLAITQRTPFWAAIFVWELARPPLWLLLVFLTCALGTYGIGRLVDRDPG
jgi:chloride channel protein, CIC family